MNALKLIIVAALTVVWIAPAHAQKKQKPIEIFSAGEASDTNNPIEITTGVEGDPNANNATTEEPAATNGATNNAEAPPAGEPQANVLEEDFCQVATNVSPAMVVGKHLYAEVLHSPEAVDKWWPFLKSAKFSITGKKTQKLSVEKRMKRVVLKTRYSKKQLRAASSDLTFSVKLNTKCPNEDMCGTQKLDFSCDVQVRRLTRQPPKKEKFETVDKRLTKSGKKAQTPTPLGRITMTVYKDNASKICVYRRGGDAVEYDCPLAVGTRHVLLPGLGPYLLVVKINDLWSLARDRANPQRVDIRASHDSFDKGQFEFGSWGKGASFTATVNGEKKTLKAE